MGVEMKKVIAILLTCLLLVATLSGCATTGIAATKTNFSIVSTIFPPYDWVRQILGDNIDDFDLTFLTDSGIDLHNFQPSVGDIARISASDMFIYVGGHSDAWVADVLSEPVNPNMIVINLMEILEKTVSLQSPYHGCHSHNHVTCHGDNHHHNHSHYCEHDHDNCDHHDSCDHHHDNCDHHHASCDHHHDCDHHDDDCSHHHESCDHNHECDDYNNDEHVWLSLNNAKVLCAAITDALTQLDPDNAEQYRANSNTYIGELSALHAEYEAVVGAASVRTLLFADRFPFLYLMNDYELSHYAAFSGCNAETEASFATMAFLIEKVNELGLTSILVTESSDQSIARTIARDSNENPQILVLDSLQSVTAENVRNGVTYLSVMESNLDVLREALR